MTNRKFFDKDGIWGRVGADKMTPELVLKLGWAAGRVLSRKGTNKVIIGKDTRISGYLFESALEAGFSAAGLDVLLTGPMPTPAIAYLTRAFRAQAGVVISASHKPYFDNGIKFFSGDGNKLNDAIELEIEAELEKAMRCTEAHLLGKVTRIDDAPGRYIEYCKGHLRPEITLSGLKVVVDCAHGATYHIAPNVFRELGADVVVIGDRPNGLNINERVGATAMAHICNTVLEVQADVGIALDGDGDRLLMANAAGEVVDGDQILYALAFDAKSRGALKGGVVGTLMSNLGLEQALTRLDIPFMRSKVGDRYVLEQLKSNGWQLGGESSGHTLSLAHGTTSDGIVTGILMLTAMQYHQQTLAQLTQPLNKYPQILINVRFNEQCNPLNSKNVQSAKKFIEEQLADSGRVLIRESGAEAVIRVMVEYADEQLAMKYANYIADAVRVAV